MKILVISSETWRSDTSGGNVLSNIFSGFDGNEFAQIYCNPGTPNNKLCTHYYQMTDSMVIKNLFSHKPIGKTFDIDYSNTNNNGNVIEQPNKKFYSFFRSHRLEFFIFIKNFIWNISNWKNNDFKSFIINFSPDIIFAPCYANKFMLRMNRYVAKLTGKKVISYISDDAYTLKQFSFSPFFWINRFIVRHELRKTFPYYSLVYTMTETQKKQCERDFGANMKILLKSVSIDSIPQKTSVGKPIRLVYAGGIYLNRWKTLAAVADAIRDINKDGKKLQLDIYTGNEISKKINTALNDGYNSIIHSSVDQTKLKDIYSKSDIALHVESFDLKNRLAVRMSFSTKIVDCLGSGCAVMAICDEKQGGYEYLKNEDAAICISNYSQIKSILESIVSSPDILIDYATKAKECCKRNHNRDFISKMICEDFALANR